MKVRQLWKNVKGSVRQNLGILTLVLSILRCSRTIRWIRRMSGSARGIFDDSSRSETDFSAETSLDNRPSVSGAAPARWKGGWLFEKMDPGFGNLSSKKQASRQVFFSKSWQVTRQDFLLDEYKTGKKNRALRLKTGLGTGFQTGQDNTPAPCSVSTTVTGPVSRIKTMFCFPV